jgi:16S rRNA (cytosine1402-N4)-methyltransferase
MSAYHTPVLFAEAIDALRIKQKGRYVDATAGGGGHAAEIVRRGGELLAIDEDIDAVGEVTKQLQAVGCGSFRVVQGNFKDIADIIHTNGWDTVDGILFDLGVSSHQLDTPARGFSYRFPEAPLDLRLSQDNPVTAKDIINGYREDDLYEIFSKLGEEKHSRTIARAISVSRAVKIISTAGDLKEIVQSIVGQQNVSATLSRVYQAIRMEVNHELEALKAGLAGAEACLHTDGRLVVISFHSLEDRIVKLWMRRSSFEIVTKKPITATQKELYDNKRARSAKLRVVRKTYYE